MCVCVLGSLKRVMMGAADNGIPLPLRVSPGGRAHTAGHNPPPPLADLCRHLLFLPPRPLASTVNDKLELQECLEHGRIAKVSPGARALFRLGVGRRPERAGRAQALSRPVSAAGAGNTVEVALGSCTHWARGEGPGESLEGKESQIRNPSRSSVCPG